MPTSASEHTKDLVAIFDIGTASVSAALVRLSSTKEARPEILATVYDSIPLDHELDFSRLYKNAAASLEAVARRLSETKAGNPAQVYCFLSSPWYASQVRSIKFSKSQPFAFTKKLARELVERDLKAFETTHLSKYKEIGSTTELIENKIMQVRLNGYRTENPFGKKAKELEMQLYFAMASKAFLDAAEYAIHKSYHVSQITFHSFAFPSLVVARGLTETTEDFLLVDIRGELTDVSLIQSDALVESISFPVGTNALVRYAGKKLGATVLETGSLLRMHTKGSLSDTEKKRLERAFSTGLSDWQRDLGRALLGLSRHTMIPKQVVLTVGGDFGPLFETVITGKEFAHQALPTGALSAILMEYSRLRAFCKAREDHDRNPFLMVESIFVNKLSS